MADTGSGIVRGMKAIRIRFENSPRTFGREVIRCPQGKKKPVWGDAPPKLPGVYSEKGQSLREEDNKSSSHDPLRTCKRGGSAC